MKKKYTDVRIVPIDAHEKREEWAILPFRSRRGGGRTIKGFPRARGNCHFAREIPIAMIDFVHRAAVKLGIRRHRIFISRGTVRTRTRRLSSAASLRELPWGAGHSILLPRSLRYTARILVPLDGEEHSLRVMEFVTLQALVKLAFPQRSAPDCGGIAARVLAKGWKTLDQAGQG